MTYTSRSRAKRIDIFDAENGSIDSEQLSRRHGGASTWRLMIVSVMNIRRVVVFMRDWLMPVCVNMRLAQRMIRIMVVLMVFVVHVLMLVLDRFVTMEMRVSCANEHHDAGIHDRTTRHIDCSRAIAKE